MRTKTGGQLTAAARLMARWAVLGVVGTIAAVLPAMRSPVFAAPPNIVVFLADDLGWGDLRLYSPNSKVATPNIDRLAAQGMRFTRAHAPAAVCAPTRYAALTGNHAWRGRLPAGTWNHEEPSQILAGQQTIADLLRTAGYATAFVGKLHMGGDFFARGSDMITRNTSQIDYGRTFANGPLAHGFDYSFALLEGIQSAPYAYFENDRLVGDPALLRTWLPGSYGLSKIEHAGIGMPYWDSSKVGGEVLKRAMRFLDRHLAAHGTSRPFFLHYAATEAHGPYTPPPRFKGRTVRGATGVCPKLDMIVELDLAVGALVNRLRRDGLLQNTLFVFTSDNGGSADPADFPCAQDSSGPELSGLKGMIEEGGHRVPMIVRWGDGSSFTVPRGKVRHQLIGVQDLTATLAAAAGVTVGADQARDSFDMLPVLLGQRDDRAPVSDHLMTAAWRDELGRTPPRFAYYEGSWKLTLQQSRESFGVLRLVDLDHDPLELTDLQASEPLRVERMLAAFRQRYAGPRSAP